MQISKRNILEWLYGVLPYVAPEVLKGKEYTQASDIYGFGIIVYEVCTGLPPYHDISHDEFLDIIQQCWDADPLKRPEARELWGLCNNLYIKSKKDNKYGDYEEDSMIN